MPNGQHYFNLLIFVLIKLHSNQILGSEQVDEIRTYFRQEVFINIIFNVSKTSDGKLTYSVCCPIHVLRCQLINDINIIINDINNINDSNNFDGNILKHGEYSDMPTFYLTQNNLIQKHLNLSRNEVFNNTDCYTRIIGDVPDNDVVVLKLFGEWIGAGRLWLDLKINNAVTSSKSFDVLVLPPPSKFGLIPTLGLFVGFSVNIFGFALNVDKTEVMPFLKRPTELLFIAFEQYLCFPLLAWLTNTILNPPAIFQFMLLSTSSASAGAITNLCCILTKGRLDLNVLSLNISPYLGLVAVPLWVCTLGVGILEKEFPDHKISFPWLQFLALKLLFILPGVMAILIKLVMPNKTRTLFLVIRPIALMWVTLMLILLAVDVLWTLNYAVDWRVSLGPIMLTAIGGIVFSASSYLLTRDPKTSLTITMQGIIANPSYGILFCLTMVPKPFTAIPICSTTIYFFTVISTGLLTTMVVRISHRLLYHHKDIVEGQGQVTSVEGSRTSIKLETFTERSLDVDGKEGCLLWRLIN